MGRDSHEPTSLSIIRDPEGSLFARATGVADLKRSAKPMIVREYIDAQDRNQVISLWKSVFGYSGARNDPAFAIDQKLKARDRLFFVAADRAAVLGTIMAGYDGHRGWVYSLAVRPERRRQGLGAALLQHAESTLVERGCPKINLQILETNAEVVGFYEKHGYVVEPRISMGKILKAPNEAPGKTTRGK